MNYPKISIITPSFNQGIYLEQTIKSVFEQEYPKLEYIIIDGGSTDNSVEIIKKYEKYLTYWVSEKDNGQTHAINKGFRISTGEIFAWQNSDDKYCEDTFQFVSDIFNKNPQIDILFGGWNFINQNGSKISSRYLRNFSIRKFYAGLQIPPQPAVFLRKSAIVKAGGFDISRPHAMDFDLYVRIINKNNVFITDRILGEFRIHQDSKTVKTKNDQFQDYRYVRKKYLSHSKGIHEKIFWLLCDLKEHLKVYVHAKTGIFSFSDLIKKIGE